ncbi:MAG: DUF494 family protein [Nitrospinaceae bacterium]|nr:DUF494 family protein [Nitrospinaceae bacterium]
MEILRERMYDMMRILVEASLRGSNVLVDERELTLMLENKGFQADEIFEAISWVHHLPGAREEYNEGIYESGRGKVIRILHPEERLAFSPAAHGLIHKLYYDGAVDEIQREEIIQRCIDLASGEIGLEEVKTVALLLLLKERKDALSENIMKILGIEIPPKTTEKNGKENN